MEIWSPFLACLVTLDGNRRGTVAGVQRVVVVGAGIVGAAAAARLAAAGARVTVVDDRAAGGATAAGAGIVATVSSRATDEETTAFRFAAARHHRELLERCAEAGITGASYRVAGQLTVALAESQVVELQSEFDRTVRLVARHGPDTVGQPELLSPADIVERFPLVGPTFGGVLSPEVAVVDGRAMRNCLLRLAVSAGADVVSGTADLVGDGSRGDTGDGGRHGGCRVSGVRTGSALFDADAVVLAAGAWSGGLTATLAGKVEPQRGQIVHLHLPGASALPTLDTFAGHYLLTFPGDRVVIGATRETGSGFDPTLTAGGVAQVLAQGFSLVPGLARATWLEARVGLRPASTDGLPYLGKAPGHQNLYVATGMGPSGLTLGPYCGSVIADAVLAALTGEPAPPIPASYDPGR